MFYAKEVFQKALKLTASIVEHGVENAAKDARDLLTSLYKRGFWSSLESDVKNVASKVKHGVINAAKMFNKVHRMLFMMQQKLFEFFSLPKKRFYLILK